MAKEDKVGDQGMGLAHADSDDAVDYGHYMTYNSLLDIGYTHEKALVHMSIVDEDWDEIVAKFEDTKDE